MALTEDGNRPGKKEVMNRSKCQRKRLPGLKRFGVCVWGRSAARGLSRVCECKCVHASYAATYFKWNQLVRLNKRIERNVLAKVVLDLLKNC